MSKFINSLRHHYAYFFLYIFLVITSFLDAQSITTAISEPRLHQKLVWSGGENSLRFNVVVEKSDDGNFINYLQEFTTSHYLDVSLQPGEYRFRIIPYDILDRPVEGSQWKHIQILSPIISENNEISMEIYSNNKEQIQILNIDSSIFEDKIITKSIEEKNDNENNFMNDYGNNIDSIKSNTSNILATFGIGGHFLNCDQDYLVDVLQIKDTTVENGTTLGVSILFTGRTGFTISVGTDYIFSVDDGGNIDPLLGFGVVYNNKFFIGGLLNFTFKPYLVFKKNNYLQEGEGFIIPTIVAGYDFGSFLIGGQLSYMYGVKSSISGFKYTLGAGVNGISNHDRSTTTSMSTVSGEASYKNSVEREKFIFGIQAGPQFNMARNFEGINAIGNTGLYASLYGGYAFTSLFSLQTGFATSFNNGRHASFYYYDETQDVKFDVFDIPLLAAFTFFPYNNLLIRFGFGLLFTWAFTDLEIVHQSSSNHTILDTQTLDKFMPSSL